ncbi:chemotaxis protein CheD [Candidatus Sumerlaeota bacterium]|nr:chemotaxis protein CheD [Candidatus Sumerlaeota bacterium]
MGEVITVGIADLKVSGDPEAEIVTYALGSCIGVALWDEEARVGGILHFMLPDSKMNREKARTTPALFADTGLPLLFREAYHLGAEKSRIVVRLVGGANILNDNSLFNIGERNHRAATHILTGNSVRILAESVGGNESLSMRLHVGSGAVSVVTGAGESRAL